MEWLVRNEFAGQGGKVRELGAECIAKEKRLIGFPVFSCALLGNGYSVNCLEVGIPEKARRYVQGADCGGCTNARTA